jgi:V8-like Glu-specific endopeptidase
VKKFLYVAAVTVNFVAAAWPIEKVEQSMAKLLSDKGGQCSAFTVAPGKWVTASHCLNGGNYTLDRQPAALVEAEFGDYGLAVLKSDLKRPVLKLGAKPKRGEDVLQTGYGAGGPLIFYEGVVVIPAITFDGAPLQFTSAMGMPGMSGGAVINRKGQLVGVVIGAVRPTEVPTLIGYGTRWEDLAALVRRLQK